MLRKKTFSITLLTLAAFFILTFGFLSGKAKAEGVSLWHQYYEPMEREEVYDFVGAAFEEAKEFYGEPLVPVKEIHIRQSIRRKQPGSLAWADITDWQAFTKRVSANHTTESYQQVWKNFSAETREKLTALATNGEELTLVEKLGIIKELNLLLAKQEFYTKQAFAGVKIPRGVMRMGGYGFLARKPNNPAEFNRALLEIIFPEAILPIPPRRPINEGIQLCECADRRAGRFVIYGSTPFNQPESRLELAHEAAHLLNTYIYDWYVEGLNNVFARELIFKYYPDQETAKRYWEPWRIIFEQRKEDNPYAISYSMMDEIYSALGKEGISKFMYFADWDNAQQQMHIEIDSWLMSLSKEDREKTLNIIRKYAPTLNKYKGKMNALVVPGELKGKL